MRPYRSIIFSRIDRINQVKRMIKEDERLRRWDTIAAISMAIMVAMILITTLAVVGVL